MSIIKYKYKNILNPISLILFFACLLIFHGVALAADPYAKTCIPETSDTTKLCPQFGAKGTRCIQESVPDATTGVRTSVEGSCTGFAYTRNDDPTKPISLFVPPVNTCWYISFNPSGTLKDHPYTIKQIECSQFDNYLKLPPSAAMGGLNTDDPQGNYVCGAGENTVKTAIDFGCRGKGNAILDLIFAIIRFLSIGVGIIIIGSIIVAGIQYTASRGDPNATTKALSRVYATVIALAIYIFSYAILNYIIPAGIFK